MEWSLSVYLMRKNSRDTQVPLLLVLSFDAKGLSYTCTSVALRTTQGRLAMNMRILIPGPPPTMQHLTPPTPKDSSQTTAKICSAMQYTDPSTAIGWSLVTFEEQSVRPHADSALATPSSIRAERQPGRQR